MVIQCAGEALRLSAGRARNHHGNFLVEIDGLFGHAGSFAEQTPRICEGGGVAKAQLHLTPAIVASAGTFDEQARADSLGGRDEVGFGFNGTVFAQRETVLAQPVLLQDSILNDSQNRRARRTGAYLAAASRHYRDTCSISKVTTSEP